MDKSKSLDVQVYYQSLRKSERGQFLKYLYLRHDYNPRTMSMKLNGSTFAAKLRCDELENIENAIQSGLWRQ